MTDDGGKPPSAIRIVRPGWIEVGGARMSLLDIKGGFESFKEVVHRAVGAEAPEMIHEFGLRGALEFMSHALAGGTVSADAAGFAAALRVYSEAGFGLFRARELDHARGWAVVEGTDAFEGWAARETGRNPDAPCCDYSRGVLLGMLRETIRSRDPETAAALCCIETACIARRGDDACVFVLGRRADLEALGHRPPRPSAAPGRDLGRLLAEARDRERQYRDLIEDVLDGIYVMDAEGRITFANRGAAAHLERPLSDIVGRHYAEFVHPDDWPVLLEVFLDLLSGRRRSVERFEGRLLTPSGEVKPFEFNGRGVYDEGGRCLRIEGVGRDLSARRRLEQRLLASERFAAVGRAAAQLAHEINNPLAVIKTSLAVVERRGLEGPGAECLRAAAEEIDRIAGIVRQLLNFYRPEPPGEARCRPGAAALDLVQMLRHQFERRAMRLEAEIAPNLPEAAIGAGAFKQVLLNLLSNAYDAMRDGDSALVRARAEGEEVVVEVEDTGAGIAAEALPRLFEPFYTTKREGGTGLGLSIVHGLVTGAGGRVEARPLERGARFVVRLPRAPAAVEGPGAA